ncbi:hypothetical protein FRC11_011774, partial [Ceratobasidium sp. 423]
HVVHADRTPESVIKSVRTCCGPEAEQLLQGRVRFIIAWRPIGQMVYSEPLAVVDWKSISDMSGLLPIHITTPRASLESFIARFNKEHEWYYLKNQ